MFARAFLSRGISTQQLAKNITLYVNDPTLAAASTRTSTPPEEPQSPRPAVEEPHTPQPTASSSRTPQEPRPLLLMLPWLGSRPQSVVKYCDIYFRTGLDVMVVTSEVSLFLWPRWGLDEGRKLLDLLQSERFVSRPLLVHAFSIGAYTFAQLLVHVSRDAQQYESLTRRIKGQVYDSVVAGSVEHMATGVGKTMFPRFESLVKKASLTYFGLFKSQTLDLYETSLDVFWNTPVKAPALFFYCKNDTMSDWKNIDELMEHWRSQGISVTGQKWEESRHAGHLRTHPQEYLSTINSFLHSLDVGSLQAKL